MSFERTGLADSSGVRFRQSDGRGIVKRKWRVDYREGAVTFVAERLQKALIKFGWPALYALQGPDVDGCEAVIFRLRGVPVTLQFREALRLLCEVEARRWRVPLVCEGCRVRISVPHVLALRQVWSGTKRMHVASLKPRKAPRGAVPF